MPAQIITRKPLARGMTFGGQVATLDECRTDRPVPGQGEQQYTVSVANADGVAVFSAGFVDRGEAERYMTSSGKGEYISLNEYGEPGEPRVLEGLGIPSGMVSVLQAQEVAANPAVSQPQSSGLILPVAARAPASVVPASSAIVSEDEGEGVTLRRQLADLERELEIERRVNERISASGRETYAPAAGVDPVTVDTPANPGTGEPANPGQVNADARESNVSPGKSASTTGEPGSESTTPPTTGGKPSKPTSKP